MLARHNPVNFDGPSRFSVVDTKVADEGNRVAIGIGE
jgi:hypothetical protein